MSYKDGVASVVIVGGGFYGVAIALYLVRRRGLKKITLLESEEKLLSRASSNNQARVHSGYHYPRSFTTANRSRVNMPRFLKDWPQVVKRDFTKLYAIARNQSKVTANQFERFCDAIGAGLKPVELEHQRLFDPRLIEKVYEVEEYAFDAAKLAIWEKEELANAGVDVVLGARVEGIFRRAGGA